MLEISILLRAVFYAPRLSAAHLMGYVQGEVGRTSDITEFNHPACKKENWGCRFYFSDYLHGLLAIPGKLEQQINKESQYGSSEGARVFFKNILYMGNVHISEY